MSGVSFVVLCLLCVIQGLTEFLPVSSSGHLLLLEQVFGIEENTFLINLFLHLATLLAVIIVYRKTIMKLLKEPFQVYTLKLFISTVITVVVAFALDKLGIETVSTKIYCFGFLLTSILLIFMNFFQKNTILIKKPELNIKDSCVVGIVQGLAVLPGLSRSGSTISALVICGNDNEKATEYSFLLSIPVIVGGFIYEMLKTDVSISGFGIEQIGIYLFAFVLTFLIAFLSLKLTIKLMRDRKYLFFSAYTFLMFIVTFIINFAM